VSALLLRRREVAPDSPQLSLYSKGLYSSNPPARTVALLDKLPIQRVETSVSKKKSYRGVYQMVDV